MPPRVPSRTGGADRCGVLGARVVVGHDHQVGEPRGELAHERALAGVPVAPGAEDDDQPAGGSGRRR